MSTDVIKHIKGESLFIDDFKIPEGTLHAAVFTSPIAHGKIININFEKALKVPGVVRILTADDIPGENQVGGIIKDESLLAKDEVHFIGEPIALILADSVQNAKMARSEIECEFSNLEVIVNPRDAFAKNSLIMPPRTFESGDVSSAWNKCDTIVEGTVESGGQEHLYLETQGAIALPQEGSNFRILSSTQSPTAVQRTIANILNLSMNNIEVDVLRLGGAFGGKEDQATHWAVFAALGAYHVNQPVKLVLSRHDDLYMTGKRHPYSSDYKIGLDKDQNILAYEATYYQNAGAVADLSPAILERTLFHATNAYYIPNVKATAISCKTNLPPNTAFRGFGGPQGKFVIEAAIHQAANKLNIKAEQIQKKNLINGNQRFYYGQIATDSKALASWDLLDEKFSISDHRKEVDDFNTKNTYKKKGLALMPICFGISFTSSFLNQASALVHVYTDGSIGVSTAAVEMGQGVNEKIKTAVSKVFSINIDRIKIETTNTTRIANTSATAASSGADLNGNAAIKASKNILERILLFASQEFEVERNFLSIKNGSLFKNDVEKIITWEELINKAYFNRINLSSHEFYSTPEIYFDRNLNQGNPFAYHVYGTALSCVTVDCLRGIYEIDYVKLVHDFGVSLDKKIDLGQVEGGLVQGIGWLTLEEVKYSELGELLSNTLSTYKVPDIYSVPKQIEVEFLNNSENRFGPFNSKAIGEPPLMYGIGSYFSILNAMKEFRPETEFTISAPITPEKVLMELYS